MARVTVPVLPAMLDLEMTGLNANYSRLICGCLKPYGEPVQTFRIDQTASGKKRVWDDRDLALQLRDAIGSRFIIMTWNGVMFDIKYLNARLLCHGEVPLPKPIHKDLLFTAKASLALTDCRLATVQEFLRCEREKTRLDPNEWIKAAAGDKAAIDYVVEHCIADVEVLEEVFERLAPFIKEMHA